MEAITAAVAGAGLIKVVVVALTFALLTEVLVAASISTAGS